MPAAAAPASRPMPASAFAVPCSMRCASSIGRRARCIARRAPPRWRCAKSRAGCGARGQRGRRRRAAWASALAEYQHIAAGCARLPAAAAQRCRGRRRFHARPPRRRRPGSGGPGAGWTRCGSAIADAVQRPARARAAGAVAVLRAGAQSQGDRRGAQGHRVARLPVARPGAAAPEGAARRVVSARGPRPWTCSASSAWCSRPWRSCSAPSSRAPACTRWCPRPRS